MTLRTLIADDEPLARALLARWVRQDPRLRLVGEATDGDEVLERVAELQAGLLFLDIRMPGLSGVEALRRLHRAGLQPYVVFVTAFDRHAVEAFDLEAGDYLVKPVRKARFAEAVDRAYRALGDRARLDSLAAAQQPLVIHESGRTTAIAPADILWVEAASQYARVHTRRGSHLVSRPLAEIASELPDPQFLRVHRSSLVNVGAIAHVRREHGACALELKDGTRVPVARARRSAVLARLERRPAGNHA